MNQPNLQSLTVVTPQDAKAGLQSKKCRFNDPKRNRSNPGSTGSESYVELRMILALSFATTAYTYKPITGSVTTGAGQLASVSTPIAGSSATVAFGYDELGRVTGQTIDGGGAVTIAFDSLGRVTNLSNPLGAFTYAYVDATSRLSGITYPIGTGLSTSYSYYGNTSSDTNPGDNDQRLSEIRNLKGSTVLSKFDYTYNPVGTIATWKQQADSNDPTQYVLGYDNADQLTSSVQTDVTTSATVSSNGYVYDPAGNRLAETTLTGTTAGQFNMLNQLTSLNSNTTSQTVAGSTTGTASSVTVDAVPATVTNGTNFTASVPLPPGTNTVSVTAKPPAGAPTTKRYQIITNGTPPSHLTYDADGNTLTDENGNSYQWDALNRLAKITYPSGASSLFAYDGLSRRIQIVEENSTGTVTSTKNYLWIGQEIAEERDSSNDVTKRFFSQGEQQAGTDYYYTRDHLGSIREMCDSSGTIQARYSYDPYGRSTLANGSNLASFQYTGDFVHEPSGLCLTLFRAYDPTVGRWLSRDPIAEHGGNNIYAYVSDDPENFIDPLGLQEAFTPAGAEAILEADAATQGITLPELLSNRALANAANIAAQAAKTAATVAAAEVAACEGVYNAYKGMTCSRCEKTDCKVDLVMKIACWSTLSALRAEYLSRGCDYILPGSIKKGSQQAEQGHTDQLVAVNNALHRCIALLANAP